MAMLKDILTQMKLRLALIVRDKMTVIVFIFCIIVFLLGISELNRTASEQTSLPVGVVDLDQSEASAEFCEKLVKLDSLKVTFGSAEELARQLDESFVRCVIVIKDGFEKKLKKGQYKGIMEMHRQETDAVATVIADIAAGEIMQEICLAHTWKAYNSNVEDSNEAKMTEEEYAAYTKDFSADDQFNFAFEFHYADTAGKEKNPTENSIFYREVVAAAAILLLSLLQFCTMAGIQFEKAQGITRRRRMFRIGMISEAIGNMAATAVCSMLAAIVFCVCVCSGIGSYEKFWGLFLITIGYCIVMSLVYFVLAKCTRGILSYQMIGSIVVLAFGVIGFCSTVDGTVLRDLPSWFFKIPNSVYLKAFIDLLA